MSSINWSKEEDAILEEGLKNGLSSSKISKLIGTRSRNAVIGRAERRGLAMNGAIFRGREGEYQTNRITRCHDASAVEAVLRLEDSQCRWPVNVDGRFEFCSNNQATGHPYCEHHARKSIQSPEERAEALLASKRYRMIKKH